MTQVISLRVPAGKVAAIDRRAADAGLDRTKYLLRVVDEDLARPAPKAKRRFASLHLLGKFRSRSSSNTAVRADERGGARARLAQHFQIQLIARAENKWAPGRLEPLGLETVRGRVSEEVGRTVCGLLRGPQVELWSGGFAADENQ